MNTPHASHEFKSDSHHRCARCTRTRLTATEPCTALHPEVLAARLRIFVQQVTWVYGKRRIKLATASELATAYDRWGAVASANWPGYEPRRIARHAAAWHQFIGRPLTEQDLELGPAGR